MASITTTEQRTENLWLAWLILFKKAVDRTAHALLDRLDLMVAIVMGGTAVAFSSVMMLYVAAYGSADLVAMAAMGTAVIWYVAVDRLGSENKGATFGFFFYLSALVPVVITAVGIGAPQQVAYAAAFQYLLPVLFAAVMLYAILGLVAWALDLIADSFTGQIDEGEKPERFPPWLVERWNKWRGKTE